MTTGATGQLGLALPVQGELSGTWGDTVNNGITQYTNIAIAGTLTLTGDGAVTLSNTTGDASASNITSTLTGAGTVTAQFAIVRVTGTLTVAKVVTGPSYSKTYTVVNAATGGIVTFKASGQTGVSVAVGESALVYFNGTDYVKAASSVVSALTGTLPVANGGTGQTSYTDGQLLIGNSTGNTLSKATLTAGTNITITNAAGAITIAASGGGSSAATPTALGTVYGITPAGTAAVALGYQAATTTTSATGVTAIGYQAGQNNTSNNVTAIGYQAGQSNTGTANTFVGLQSGTSNTSGTQNSSFGQGSFGANTTGSNNVAIGRDALQANTTASNNTAVGYQSLYSNVTGTNNTATGFQAGYANTASSGVTAFGYQALTANTSGAENDAFGNVALKANTTGGNNSVFGTVAMFSNTTGSNNVAVGNRALYSNTTSLNNTAVGFQALYSMTATGTGNNNTAVGYQAGYANTGGASVFIGYNAGGSCTAANNIFIGLNAGATNGINVTTGTNNVVVGNAVSLAAATNSNSVVIGDNVNGKGSNTGFISPGGGGVYQGNNSATWSVASDQRLKKNIVDNTIGLDAITSIRVRNFEYRLPEEVIDLPQTQAIQKNGMQLGVIAQELQEVLPDCVKQESTGVLTVDQNNLTWYLINAVKELSARVKQLEGN